MKRKIYFFILTLVVPLFLSKPVFSDLIYKGNNKYLLKGDDKAYCVFCCKRSVACTSTIVPCSPESMWRLCNGEAIIVKDPNSVECDHKVHLSSWVRSSNCGVDSSPNCHCDYSFKCGDKILKYCRSKEGSSSSSKNKDNEKNKGTSSGNETEIIANYSFSPGNSYLIGIPFDKVKVRAFTEGCNCKNMVISKLTLKENGEIQWEPLGEDQSLFPGIGYMVDYSKGENDKCKECSLSLKGYLLNNTSVPIFAVKPNNSKYWQAYISGTGNASSIKKSPHIYDVLKYNPSMEAYYPMDENESLNLTKGYLIYLDRAYGCYIILNRTKNGKINTTIKCKECEGCNFDLVCNSASPSCKDTDFGINIFLYGEVSNISGTYKDTCSKDGTLTEYYCEDGKIKKSSGSCPTGFTCKDGRCVNSNIKINEVCKDTDFGINIFLYGKAFDNTSICVDKCNDDKNLTECYCGSGKGGVKVKNLTLSCPSGYICKNGRCILSQPSGVASKTQDECTSECCTDCFINGEVNPSCIGDNFCNPAFENCENSKEDCSCEKIGKNYICCPEHPEAEENGCFNLSKIGGKLKEKGEECYCDNMCGTNLKCTEDLGLSEKKHCCPEGEAYNGKECVERKIDRDIDCLVVSLKSKSRLGRELNSDYKKKLLSCLKEKFLCQNPEIHYLDNCSDDLLSKLGQNTCVDPKNFYSGAVAGILSELYLQIKAKKLFILGSARVFPHPTESINENNLFTLDFDYGVVKGTTQVIPVIRFPSGYICDEKECKEEPLTTLYSYIDMIC